MSACLNDCWVRPATTRVASTMNPQEVCALHRKNGYDLILLDLQMPSMDGFQVMADLKTNASDSYLPVIVLTAQPAHRLRALQTGAKDFISKPFDLLEVKARIHNMLEVRLLYKNSRVTGPKRPENNNEGPACWTKNNLTRGSSIQSCRSL